MSLALYIFLFLALMDPFAILALLPGGDAVSADADGGADAASGQGNLLPGADAVSDQGNLSIDAIQDGHAHESLSVGRTPDAYIHLTQIHSQLHQPHLAYIALLVGSHCAHEYCKCKLIVFSSTQGLRPR